MYVKIVFQVSLKFDPAKKNTENTMSNLYFNEESDYSEENTSDSEDCRFTILQPFQVAPKEEKRMVMTAMRKKLQKQLFADILQNMCS